MRRWGDTGSSGCWRPSSLCSMYRAYRSPLGLGGRSTSYPAPASPFIWFTSCRFISCRSEEHTSELQSLMRISYAVFCLKKQQHTQITTNITNQHKTTDE